MSTDTGPTITADTGPEPAPPVGPRSSRGWMAPAVVLVVVAALALAAMTGGDDGGEPAAPVAVEELPAELTPDPDIDLEADQAAETLAQAEARAQLEALATRLPDDPRALGAVDAPVVMVEWADFLCPFCGVFARDTEPQLIERYVDTGILRIEWRDLPFQGEEALLAALGGQAAAEQDAFWEYHEAVFAFDLRRGDGRMSRAFLLEVATDLGLDVAAFELALDDPAVADRVQGEAALGQAIGITGTPAFLIGGYPIRGAQPLETFVSVIENAAIEAGVTLP